MAHSIWVLLRRAQAPEPLAVQATLDANELPLALGPDPEWSGREGWLPLRWRGEESGCEVEWERKLRKKDAHAAARAGVAGADAAVVVTARGGWVSHQSAVALAAAVAIAARGCVADGGRYVGSDDALEWAYDGIAAADKAIRREHEAARIREEMERSGNAEQVFEELLARLVGTRAKMLPQPFDGSLVIVMEGPVLRASAWRLEAAGKVLEHTRRTSAMVRLLEATGAAGEEPGPEERRALQGREREVRVGEAEDARDAAAAFAQIERWPSRLTIAKLTWDRPACLRLRFGELDGVLLVLEGGGLPSDVSVGVQHVDFVLGERLKVR